MESDNKKYKAMLSKIDSLEGGDHAGIPHDRAALTPLV
jgi:hypothetical protein